MELGLKIWLFVGAILLIIPLLAEAALDPVCGEFRYHPLNENDDDPKRAEANRQLNKAHYPGAERTCTQCCSEKYKPAKVGYFERNELGTWCCVCS